MMQKLKRPVSILLVFMMIVSLFTVVPITASAAPTESLLITINSVGHGEEEGDGFISGSRTFNNIATVAFSDRVENDDDNTGWYTTDWSDKILSVAPAAGYTITKVKFYNFYNGNRSAFDEATPFEATLNAMNMYVNGSSCGRGGVAKIEVYGYATPTYTVTWKNGDTVIETDTGVAEGSTPTYNGNTPEKAEDANNTYTFSGWTDSSNTFYSKDSNLPAVTKDETYTAQFTATPKRTPADDVKDLINALPTTVTVNDKEQIEAARAAYNALTDDQKALIDNDSIAKLEAAEKVIADLEAVKAVEDMIKALPAVEDITLNDKDAVNATYDAFGALTDDQIFLLDGGLFDDLLDALQKIQDLEAAKVVEDKIKALPDVILLEDKADVEDARAAYDALEPEQKALITPETLKALEAAETVIANREAAKAVEDQINALPAASEITLADKPAVEAAHEARENLTPAEVEYLTMAAIDKLFKAEDKIRDLETAKAVTDLINALPADITLNDKAAVEAARKAYDDLTADRKDLVANETLEKLAAAEKVIADREAAKAVEDMINALPAQITSENKQTFMDVAAAYIGLSYAQADYLSDEAQTKGNNVINANFFVAAADQLPEEVTLEDKALVGNLRAYYDDANDGVKALISDEYLNKLKDAEKVIADREAAKAVEDQINALPDKVTPENRQDFKDVASAYMGLTYAQADYIPQETQDKITNSFMAVFLVEGVVTIPDEVTLEDKAFVDNLVVYYNDSPDAVKAFITEETLNKLNAAKKTVDDLAAAKDATDKINALPEKVTVDDKDQIEAARAAFDALTDDQRALVDEEALSEKLAAAEAALQTAIDIAAADAVTKQIEALPSASNVTVNDKDSIDAAKAAFDALTDDQKKLVPLSAKLKLAADMIAYAAAQKAADDEAAATAVEDMIRELPSASAVTINDKDAIEAAAAAYDALTDDQKKLVSLVDRIKLSAVKGALAPIVDEAAGNAVEAMIRELPAAADVTVDDKAAIEEAAAAYDALTDAQKRYVSAADKAKLTAVKEALTAAEDEAAADAVEAMIRELPASADVTINDKEAIEAAFDAYNALTAAQKRLVALTERIKLIADKEALAALEDEAAGNAVEDMIRALPDPAEITLDDKAAVEEARAAFDALTNAQKKYVTLVDRNKLVADEAAIKKLEDDNAAAQAVADMINALPAAEDVTLEDAYNILAAKAAYNNLTEDQKALIDEDVTKKLDDAYAAYAALVDVETVAAMINALPAAEDVTYSDKADIDEARVAYDALSDAQKALIDDETYTKLTDAEAAIEKIEEDMAAADAVEDMIKALPKAADITVDDKAQIEEAAAAYDALTDAQKGYVSLADKLKLTVAKAALDAAEKAAEDEAAGNAVEDMIRALPDPADITIDDKAAVEEARAALDALTDAQKKYVSLVDKVKLAAAEDAIEKIENDIAAAQAVADMINALPAAEDVTLEDAYAILDAKAAYNNLTEEQKALIDDDTVKKLDDAYNAYAALVDVDTVKAMINALPAAEDITYRDKAAVEEARGAYDALNDDQKALIDDETYTKLTDAEAAIAQIEEDIAAADAVEELIEALPKAADITVDDKAQIEEAAAAYDALTDAQKGYVSLADKIKLAVAKGALDAAEKAAEDEAAGNAVEDMIRALPDPDEITLDDKAAVEETRAAYDALTSDQKKYVSVADKIKLAADEAAIEKLENDNAAAQAVTDMINALPAAEDVTLDDARDILNARSAYDALTEDQKALIDDETVQKLEDAENALLDHVAADAIEMMMNELPEAEDVTINDKDYIEAVREAYDDLSDAQKALIGEDAVQKLEDAEKALAEIEAQIEADKEAANAVSELIKALPNATEVTINDKAAIEEAAAAYDALTDAQKGYVSLNDKLKLTLDKAALDAAEKAAEDEAAGNAVEDMIRALPDPAEITLDDKAAVEEARAAYDALTPDQKKYVSLADKIKLAADEGAIEKIENDIAAAQAVTDMINALPAAEDVTLDDARDILDARAAYEALTDDQKALIDDETVQKLEDAENALTDQANAEIVKEMINLLPEADDVTMDDKPFIEDVRAAYDNLSDTQKALIDADTYKKLTDAEDALNNLFLLGDVDGDGSVTAVDATLLQRYGVHIGGDLDDDQLKAGDVNFDGKVNIIDVTLIQRYLTRMDVDYPIGEYI